MLIDAALTLAQVPFVTRTLTIVYVASDITSRIWATLSCPSLKAKRSGVDSLAVAIGNSHGAYKFKGEQHLDLERLKAIKSALMTAGFGDFPLVLGGDHSIGLGSINGVANVHKNVGVLWIDAHADFNTDQSTPSGNIHGMILASLAGLGNSSLTNIGGWSPKIHKETIVIVGARDLDPGEQELLRTNSIHVFTMSEIDQLGITEVMQQALAIAGQNNDGIHLSLDMDALDPTEAPGVGTPVRGGLTYREAHLAMELIADSHKLVSMDVVEVNPILDRENATALLAVELVLSALGKKIL